MSATQEAESQLAAEEAQPAGAPDASRTSEPAATGNVDKIRDILFGSHIRDYEVRFNRLEETLAKETTDVRETTRRRLDTLEAFVKRELEALQTRLSAEREERSESIQRLSGEMKDLGDSIAKKIRAIEDHQAGVERQFREQLLEQSEQLREEMRAQKNELSALIDRRFQELRSAKTDRAGLASLLTEVAMKLNDEFHVPQG
jgi:predicted  nucleic acid-binding Zn-ribbon protein